MQKQFLAHISTPPPRIPDDHQKQQHQHTWLHFHASNYWGSTNKEELSTSIFQTSTRSEILVILPSGVCIIIIIKLLAKVKCEVIKNETLDKGNKEDLSRKHSLTLYGEVLLYSCPPVLFVLIRLISLCWIKNKFTWLFESKRVK